MCVRADKGESQKSEKTLDRGFEKEYIYFCYYIFGRLGDFFYYIALLNGFLVSTGKFAQ